MKSTNNKLPLLPEFFLIITVLFFLVSGCNSNLDKIKGKVYLYEDSIYTFTAGFDKDTLYYIMKDAQRPYFHRSKYTSKKVDDSTFIIELTDKPKFWEKNTWEIVVKDDKGFFSKESRKYYKLYSDSMIVKKAF